MESLGSGSAPNILDSEEPCTLHMFIKGTVPPVVHKGLVSPTYCHAKLHNTSSMQRTCQDVRRSLIMHRAAALPMPDGFRDALLPAKRGLVGWYLAASRTRGPQQEEKLEKFIRWHNGDWHPVRSIIVIRGKQAWGPVDSTR